MEFAAFISKTDNLKYFDNTFTRLYFGNEFCEELIPCTDKLDAAIDFVIKRNADFTLVTPFVTNKGIKRLIPLLKRVSELELGEKKIERVEFDNVLQDINFNFLSNGITVSLYLPFAYVSTTRFCLANSCDIPEKLEQVGIYPCRKECQRYTFLLQNPAMPVPLLRKGNTIFFKNELPPKGFNEANISRVVIEPEIPM